MHAKRDVFPSFYSSSVFHCCHCWVTPGPLTVKEEKKEVKTSRDGALSIYYLRLEFYRVTHVGRFSIIHNRWNQTCETERDRVSVWVWFWMFIRGIFEINQFILYNKAWLIDHFFETTPITLLLLFSPGDVK